MFMGFSTANGLALQQTVLASATLGFLQGSTAEIATRESQLLGSYETATVPDRFQILGTLSQLYCRHLRHGGRDGMHWNRLAQTELSKQVQTTGNYSYFIQADESRGHVIDLPSTLPYPALLNWHENPAPPVVVYIKSEPQRRRHFRAYFLIDQVLSREATMLDESVAEATADFAGSEKAGAIELVLCRRSARYFLNQITALPQQILSSAATYVLGRVVEESIITSAGTPLRSIEVVSQATLDARRKPEPPTEPITIATELTFQPQWNPQFTPLRFELQRQGKPCPVIIERISPQQAKHVAGSIGKDILSVLNRTSYNPDTNLILVMRGLDGEPLAASVNGIHRYKDEASLRGESAFKADQSNSGIRKVGLAFLIARILFLKRNSSWGKRGTAISNFIPRVLARYRSDAGLPESYVSASAMNLDLDTVSYREADQFLERNPLIFREMGRPQGRP